MSPLCLNGSNAAHSRRFLVIYNSLSTRPLAIKSNLSNPLCNELTNRVTSQRFRHSPHISGPGDVSKVADTLHWLEGGFDKGSLHGKLFFKADVEQSLD